MADWWRYITYEHNHFKIRKVYIREFCVKLQCANIEFAHCIDYYIDTLNNIYQNL